jgi:hypothetical protein
MNNQNAISSENIEIYWTRVLEALKQVFNQTEDEATLAVTTIRNRLQTSINQGIQVFFYTEDPFTVAADWAMFNQPITQEQTEAYIVKVLKLPENDRPPLQHT